MKKFTVIANYYHHDGFTDPTRNQTDRIKARMIKNSQEVVVGEFDSYAEAFTYIVKECKFIEKKKKGKIVNHVTVRVVDADGRVISGEYYVVCTEAQ